MQIIIPTYKKELQTISLELQTSFDKKMTFLKQAKVYDSNFLKNLMTLQLMFEAFKIIEKKLAQENINKIKIKASQAIAIYESLNNENIHALIFCAKIHQEITKINL